MSSDIAEYRYECHLDATGLEKARKELHEEEKEREGAVIALRDWVTQQSWLNSPTDFAFLLRFLRVRKFSQLAARTTLENFWTERTKIPEWFRDVSSDSEDVLDLISSGYCLILPEPDSEGRRIMLSRPGIPELKGLKKKYGIDALYKTYFCLFDWMCMDERIQVNGFVVVADSSGSDQEIADLFSINACRKMFPLYLKAYPLRQKGTHLYNANILVDAVAKLVRSTLMPEKLAQRMHIHGKSLVTVYDAIGKHLLPKEYLPDDYEGPCVGTIADVVEYMKSELCRPEVVSHIKDLNSGRYNVDLKQREKEDVPVESFRKLNVD